ncbi:ABC transporter substrate-binding protein [Paenibacillus piri]|uniref:ABC transporter substrate-binding protein n=1 Tax=Paenibacillus piri TaxID=2547395 RepID=UPI0014054CBC|nr:sugar ABC transporter substrate-binding protein [Paenibacillus piri]
MNKTFFTVILSAVTVGTILSGCSNEPGTGSGSNKNMDARQPVTIKFWHRWPESQKALEEVAKGFMDKYPHIKVEMPTIASAQYTAQLQAAISSSDLPDIFSNQAAVPVDQLNQLGLIHELDDLFPAKKKEQFYEGTWTEGFTTMGGKIYAVPHFTPRRYAHVMYYNKNVLKNAGLSDKDVPKTWDELVAVGQKIRQSGGDVYPLILGVKTDWLMTGFIGQMATAIKPEVVPNDGFNLKKGEYEFNSPGYSETIQFLKKLQDDKLLHPNSLVINYREASSLFAGGKAAFIIDGTFLSSELQQNNKFNDFGVAPLPTKDGKQQYYAFQGETKASIHVKKDTKHYEEVKLFLNYYMENYYVKQLEMGIEGSPIIDQNKNTKVDNPQFVTGQKIQDETFVLSPHPFTRNTAAIQVNTEMNGKKPKENIGKILEGYLAGQVKDLNGQLNQLTADYNKAFKDAMNKVTASGGKITPADYQFPNWVPLQPYTKDKYNELKK